MANYETLADGGHEHLIATVKPLVDQKANEHDIDVSVKELVENQPRGQLTGEVLTTSHAYDMPPVSVTVDGRSTQDGTPTPDAPVEIQSVENPALKFAGENVLDPSFLTRCGWTENNGQYTGTPKQLYQGLANHITPVDCAQNTQYVFAWYQVSTTNTSNTNAVDFRFVYSDGTQSASKYTDLNHTFTNVSAEGKTVVGLRFSYVSNPTLVVQCIQLVPLALWDDKMVESYTPYVTPAAVTLPVTLRSLPDGTKDTLALSYLRPSTREGWAWYTPTLTQNIQRVTFDETENWRTYSYTSGAGYYTTTKVRDHYGHMKLCNMAISANSGAGGKNTCYFGGAGEVNMVGVTDSAPTLADWLALVAATPVIVDYHLTTPVTTTLDPIELPHMPLGDVTIWSDPTTGLTVNYIVEGKSIEASLETGIANALAAIATVETSPTTYNHAVGSRIVYDEVLYRVTSAIASGEDIVPGTNVEATTVTDEIKRLQQ